MHPRTRFSQHSMIRTFLLSAGFFGCEGDGIAVVGSITDDEYGALTCVGRCCLPRNDRDIIDDAFVVATTPAVTPECQLDNNTTALDRICDLL